MNEYLAGSCRGGVEVAAGERPRVLSRAGRLLPILKKLIAFESLLHPGSTRSIMKPTCYGRSSMNRR